MLGVVTGHARLGKFLDPRHPWTKAKCFSCCRLCNRLCKAICIITLMLKVSLPPNNTGLYSIKCVHGAPSEERRRQHYWIFITQRQPVTHDQHNLRSSGCDFGIAYPDVHVRTCSMMYFYMYNIGLHCIAHVHVYMYMLHVRDSCILI